VSAIIAADKTRCRRTIVQVARRSVVIALCRCMVSLCCIIALHHCIELCCVIASHCVLHHCIASLCWFNALRHCIALCCVIALRLHHCVTYVIALQRLFACGNVLNQNPSRLVGFWKCTFFTILSHYYTLLSMMHVILDKYVFGQSIMQIGKTQTLTLILMLAL
jgi:hypothetical protein